MPDIGIHMDKLNGVIRVSEKIFQMFTMVSGYSDSESYTGKIAWPVFTRLSSVDRRSVATV
jgi:hypothetical protein